MKPTHAVIETGRGKYGIATIERADSLDRDRILCLTFDGKKARKLAELYERDREDRRVPNGGPSYLVGPVPACSNEELWRWRGLNTDRRQG